MSDDERILDLLTERLERTLSEAERVELDRLLAANPDWRRHDIDLAAAAIHLAFEPDGEPMPEAVKARLIGRVLGDATRPSSLTLVPTVSSEANIGDADPTGPRRVPLTDGGRSGTRTRGGRPRARALLLYTGWASAAAAVVIAVIGWWPRGDSDLGRVDLAGARAELVRERDVVQIAWAQTADPLGKTVKGDVVWSASSQSGVMRFSGLPANDPKTAQYQLWIFDQERDERYPVDGGVFDVGKEGETLVAIRARVPVGRATLFAVTLEKPGGVVVSTRERLVALAKVS